MNADIRWLYGIDGCPAGWVVAKSDAALRRIELAITPAVDSLFAQAESDSIIGIDIPIGLTENEARACDVAARRLLGWPRRTSVFSPPIRRALHAKGYPEALRLNQEAAGVGISKQTFCIMPKIIAIDRLMDTNRQRFIREVHPEVTFAKLNGAAMLYNKKRPEGRTERLVVLQNSGLSLSESWLSRERVRLGVAGVSLDDLLDAFACLITAFHISTKQSQSLGNPAQRDAKGLLMEIVTGPLADAVAPA